MEEAGKRIFDPVKPPTISQIESWMGKDAYKRWKRVTQLIDRKYPDVFSPDWIFGGKKYGWALRYKKGRSFCTLLPEKNSFGIQIVFGLAERAKAETMLHQLSTETQQAYKNARTYHDGKWLFLKVDSAGVIDDIEVLFSVKRKPAQQSKNS